MGARHDTDLNPGTFCLDPSFLTIALSRYSLFVVFVRAIVPMFSRSVSNDHTQHVYYQHRMNDPSKLCALCSRITGRHQKLYRFLSVWCSWKALYGQPLCEWHKNHIFGHMYTFLLQWLLCAFTPQRHFTHGLQIYLLYLENLVSM